MEILFDNPLANMYGPYFLVFFGFIIFFAVIALLFVKTQFDRSDKLAVPRIPPNIDPYEIAYLRGGVNEVARSVIFSLLQKGHIEIDNLATPPVIKKTQNLSNPNRLNEIEQLAFGWLGASREPKEIFGANSLTQQLGVYANLYQGRLEQQQFLTSEEVKSSFNPVKFSFYGLILAIGGYKLLAAVLHQHYNLIFLIILLIGGLLAIRAAAKLPRLTKLGKIYLERLQTAFDNLKYASQRAYIASNEPKTAPQTTFAGIDPLLLSVGIFGSGILAGTIFDGYNSAFQRANNAAAISSGSCGSSCGSCSSGSSCSSGGSSCSSGDSGGSSCSSGCGGCGGGGD